MIQIPPINRSKDQEKEKRIDMIPILVRLYRYFGKHRATIILVIVMGFFSNILSIIGPQYLSDMTDSVAFSIESGTAVDVSFIFHTVLILITIYAIAALLQYLSARTSWITEEIIGDNLRIELSRKISRIPVKDIDGMRSGDIISRFVNDTDTIRLRSTDCIVNTINAVVMFSGTLVMMVYTDWRLAVIALMPSTIGFIVIRYIVKISQKYYRMQSRNLGRMNSIVEETFRGLDVVRSYNGMETIERDFGEVNDLLYHSAVRSRFMGSLMPGITGFVNNFTYVLVCVMGSLFVLGGTSSFGTIVAFIVYVKLMVQPMQSITRSLGDMQDVTAACERIFEFMDIEEIEDDQEKDDLFVEVQGNITFDDVSFSYEKGREVIHNLTLDVEAGQRIAIVGPTGAGKTTIANLLLRFYEPDSGTILIDGMPISKISRHDVRQLYGVVSQDVWLFKGTLRQNIVFGDNSFTDEQIMEVCSEVGLDAFIHSLSDGIDTYIQDPSMLSNGQRQQITIARAVLRKAPILIMDEATSSVDTRTERQIQSAMDRLMEGHTSFIIAHRLSTIMGADRILVMRNGKIVESGTHDELLRMNGFYRDLYDSQFEYCD